MGKVVSCIIARTVSTRLPLKVLRSVGTEYSMLDFMIKRLKAVKSIDEVFICTSDEAVDEIMVDVAARNAVKVYRGSPDNVIERMLAVGEATGAELLLRITGDNPFTATEYIDTQVELLRKKKLDYVRVIDVPIGATAEVMTHDALKRCYQMMDPSVSEYLMLFMFEPQHFRCGVVKPFKDDLSNWSLTVDTPADYERTRAIMTNWKNASISITLNDIVSMTKEIEIPNLVIKPSGKIKLPYGKTVDFEEFLQDMNRRIEQSDILRLYA
jgi:spore coat polysaccharide biosynthesis protein SpsF